MQTAGDSRLGTTVENYKLLSVLGAGSMSVVYLAQRLDDPRVLVAVKILTYPGPSSPEDHMAFRLRFQREARAASELRNEHILPVLSSGDAGDLQYMVMPVIVGGTLTARLAHQPQPMPLAEVTHYLTQLASAIDYAHAQGVVHRDIKPSNILLDEHGHIYLTDFGIARLFDSGDNALTRESAPTLTRTGQVLGTPYYMAPEQIQAKPAGPAADIYALGVVVYQMVTGQVPFHGDTPLAIALQHLQDPPGPPSQLRHELPPALEAIILRALAKNPADRYASAGEFAEAFQEALDALDDPMATRLPAETWPFSTRYASSASTVSAPVPSTPAPQSSVTPDRLTDLGLDSLDGYHLGSIIESDELGTIYTAQRDDLAEPVRIRFLPLPPDASPKEIANYLLQFEQMAHNLTALRHPNLAPLLGYGAYEGQPYLVQPDHQGVSLNAELAQHGAADLSAVADCLDQIVAGLEYAHRRGFLHLSLTCDRLFRQDDGRIVVADVGVRGLLDKGALDAEREQPYLSVDANTPEQLVGDPVGTYTDVYALGVVLYHLLTGREVFTGVTHDDIAQQHLHSTIPPVRRWRPSLPTTLDRVLSQALAKEPQRRFQTPRELAAAYHTAVAHTQHDTAVTGTPAYAALRHTATGAAAVGAAAAATGGSATPVVPTTRTPSPTKPIQAAQDAQAASPPATPPATPPRPPARAPGQPQRPNGSRLLNNPLAVALGLVLVVGIIAGVFAWYNAHSTAASGPGPIATNSVATVSYLDNTTNGSLNTDALNIDVTSLPTPQAGHWYQAWLIDDQSEQILPLGKLVPKPGQDKAYLLRYGGSGSPGHPGANLLASGNRIKITYESQSGSLPAGPVMMEGAFPPIAFVHIKHLLVAFPDTPQKQGLLVGMVQQMNLLYQQANVLQQWISLHYPKSTLCAAQSVVDIIEGKSGPHYQPMAATCNVVQQWPAGDGYGLLGAAGYLAGVADHAALAASAKDATAHIRLHSQHVQIAVSNIKGWLQTVDQDAVNVLTGSGDVNTTTEIVHLSKIALTGQDVDGDESIDPVPNEAGADLAYTHAQLLSTLTFGPSH